MATKHKQLLADYLASHKHASSSGPAPRPGAAQSTVEGKRNASGGGQRPPPSRSVRTKFPPIQARGGNRRQLTGRTPDLDGYLPDEMLLKVFSYLDIGSLITAGRVNRRWCMLTRDDSLWKGIAQRYVKDPKTLQQEAEKRNGSVHAAESFHTQWKNACIERCAKWRNQRALKLVRKCRLNPFTGLPKETEKALRETGVTFQLSLVDNYDRERCTESSKVTLHKSAVGVMWHSLSFPGIHQVRRLRILAICPLFYNDAGKVVKGSPYQRSLLWETNIRLSEWTTEKHVLAADDQITVYRLPGDLLIATWKSGGEVAFFAAGLHYHHLVQRCMLGSPTECYSPTPHKVIPDDIDSSYGLHDYRASVELRTMHQTLWSQQFSGLHCRLHDLALGAARFSLIRHDSVTDHTPLERRLALPWRTELFKGVIENAAWLDVTVLDERGEVFASVSAPIRGKAPSVKGSDMEYDESAHLLITQESERVTVHMQIGKLDHGKAFVRYLELLIKTDAVNQWFGTKYLSAV